MATLSNTQTSDMVIQPNDGLFRFTNPILPPDHFVIADDMYVGKIDDQAAKILLDFGDPNGYQIDAPQRQWGYFYAFVRKVEESAEIHRWDTDQRLQKVIALSRLVRPTSISFRNAGRVRYNDDGSVRHAFPAWLRGVDPDSWLPADKSYRDWLITEELVELKLLSDCMTRATLPVRVSRALWYHEYAARTYYGEVRWILVCTALESMLNTYEYNSGAQFRGRVWQLAGTLSVAMTEDEARRAWGMRSHLSHGGATGKLTPEEEEIYKKLEEILRGALKKAIVDDSFASVFADDSAIRSRWPIIVDGRSI
jgi:hypothetical protein